MVEKCSVNGQRQTVAMNCEKSTMWETKAKTTPQKTGKRNGTGSGHEA
jgi:hypothetical protein